MNMSWNKFEATVHGLMISLNFWQKKHDIYYYYSIDFLTICKIINMTEAEKENYYYYFIIV